MSVKRKTIKFQTFKGQDQRWKGELGGADAVVNMRVDDEGLGWIADRGLEPWWDPGATVDVPSFNPGTTELLGSSVDSCYVWTKQNTGQTYYIIEQAGLLYYWLGNKNQQDYKKDYVQIDSLRHIPKGKDTGTQYIPFGNRLLIINGYDAPVWFYGRGHSRDFGFSYDTPFSDIIDIQTDYLNGTELSEGIASPVFEISDTLGLGDPEDRNHYTYKFSYITDSGSESPLSSDISIDWFPDQTQTEEIKKLGLVMPTIPVGPKGTVSRNIYRTKNQKTFLTGGANAKLYFLKTIRENASDFFIDIIPDGNLVEAAPKLTDSVKISGSYNVAANWNGRMWLAGGAPHPTKIIYSVRGLPEQFAQANYFELGNTEGGHITGLQSYYNNLIVFRQSSIDVIRILSDGSFSHSQVSPNVGTTATNTIKLVPGIGICFLSTDGIYAVNGGMDGGSKIDVTKISMICDKDIKRINRTSINNAISGYSKKEKEYWCHFPSDTGTVPNRGLVLHVDNMQWSSRRSVNKANDDLFRFSAMTIDTDGSFIFGTAPKWLDTSGNVTTPGSVNATGNLAGQLYVWSGSQKWGKTWTNTGTIVDPFIGSRYSISDIALPKSVYESNWTELEGNDTKHRILSVELEILSYGDNNLQLSYATDHSFEYNLASSQKQNRPETLYTASEDPVAGPEDRSISKNFFKINDSRLQNGRITRLRYDVNTGLINNFKFKIECEGPQTPFHIISFHINYSTSHQQTLNAGIK